MEKTDFLEDKLFHDFTNKYTTEIKSDGTVVTPTDYEIEDCLRNSILSQFPNHGIHGEERGQTNPSSPYKWIIDPIDGTVGFSRGVPLWGTLIGLLHDGVPIYGFLRIPSLCNTWISGNNEKTFVNGLPVTHPCSPSNEKVLILTTDLLTIENSPIEEIWKKALNLGCLTRTWGDCFGYFLLCTGRADMMVDTGLKPHDILPLLPILFGSGIIVKQFGCTDYSHIAAVSPRLAKKIF